MFEVAIFRHLPDEALNHHPPSWLLDQYERVDRTRWYEKKGRVEEVEAGVMRALSRAFGKEEVPDLPTYDEIMNPPQQNAELPAWMQRYEKANRPKLPPTEPKP